MAVVVDASVAAAWCFRDEEGSGEADAAIGRLSAETGIVPGLFWHEMRNVLVVAERRGRIEYAEVERYLYHLRSLPLLTDNDQSDIDTVALARRHGLSGYDAAYLETARRHGADLATLDRELANASAQEGL